MTKALLDPPPDEDGLDVPNMLEMRSICKSALGNTSEQT